MNGRENASHTKRLADACISQIFLAVERSHGSSAPISYFFLSPRESPFLLAQPFFPLTHTRTAQIHSYLSQFLETASMFAQYVCMNVYFSFTDENQHSHSRQVNNGESRKNRKRYSILQT